MAKGKYWIAMVKVDKDYYVVATDDGIDVNDFGSREKALEFIGIYDATHMRSVPWINSAVVSKLGPRIIGVNLELLTEKLFDEKATLRHVRIDAGLSSFMGLKCNRQYSVVERVYNSGEAPELGRVEA